LQYSTQIKFGNIVNVGGGVVVVEVVVGGDMVVIRLIRASIIGGFMGEKVRGFIFLVVKVGKGGFGGGTDGGGSHCKHVVVVVIEFDIGSSILIS
jgi:hypothetical protein